MLSIGVASADWGRGRGGELVHGGANWVRLRTPMSALETAGHEVQFGSAVAIQKATAKMVILDHDGQPIDSPPQVVVLQRWMHENAAMHIKAARAAGQIIINDIDDWFEGLDPANQAWTSSHPKVSATENRNHYRRALAASSLLTVSTDYLADRYHDLLGVKTVVLRNTVDRTHFDVQPVRDATQGLRVGWVGAVSWRSGDLETIAGVFGDWLKASGSQFVHHGVTLREPKPSWKLLRLDDEQVAGWREMVVPTEYGRTLMTGMDIGLVPLADVPFNHAKSWIKGLEYGAAGIPFVAFKTAEYEALDAGLLAKRPRDWTRQLDRLLDPEVRRQVQERGIAAAERNDIAVRWIDWEKAYYDALRRA